MYGSRRFWLTAALGLALAVVGVLAARPEPIVGAAGIGAWLVAAQVRALRAFQRTAGLEVTLETATRQVAVDRPVACRLVVDRPTPDRTTVVVEAPKPLGARSGSRSERTARLAPGATRAATTFDLRFPVAGQFTFDAPEVDISDALGLFTETLTRGSGPTVQVEPGGPRDLHIGRGGDRVVGAYGEHRTAGFGAGTQPEELREYVAGDPADRIDWKATARLNRPYVREYEVETDRQTVLIVDHRAEMARGTGRQTMLSYARETALAVAATAISMSDPLGLYAVGDEGLTTRHPPSTSPDSYAAIRAAVGTLEATGGGRATAPTGRPARARRAASHLAADRSRFAAKTRPFLSSTDAYVERLTGDPLFSTVQRACSGTATRQWTTIITSDTDPPTLREAVRLAAQRSAAVLVFITPSVLFEDTVPEVDAAYQQYVAFEDLRRELDRMPGVTAFEVAPGDRLEQLLATRRARPRA